MFAYKNSNSGAGICPAVMQFHSHIKSRCSSVIRLSQTPYQKQKAHTFTVLTLYTSPALR